MKRLFPMVVVLLLAVVAMAFATACGDDDDGGSGGGSEDVSLTQGGDLKIAVITHGSGDSFWAVAKRGAEQAGKDMGVEVQYSESANDPQKQAQLIDAAVTDKVDGIAVSAPNPDALVDPLKKAADAGIPIITLNSGQADSADLGAITHVGQDETIAGEAAGRRLAEGGSQKLLCVIHEQANIGLNQRCDGAKQGFGGEVENLQVKGVEDISTTLTEIQSKLESDDSIDAVLTLNPDIAVAARDAVQGASSDAKLATFDLSGDVVNAIEAGEIEFAIDQQQYLQGYMGVEIMTLYAQYGLLLGGGDVVRTGPGFVTQETAAQVIDLSSQGIR
jgi:simple sugar transport system substrate-binding protein